MTLLGRARVMRVSLRVARFRAHGAGYDWRMRGNASVVVVILVAACASKAPAPVATGAVRHDAREASPADSSRAEPPVPATPAAAPPDPSPANASPSESPTPSTSVSPQAGVAPPAATEQRPTAAETRACAARGGTIQPICMMGELACVVRYRDAGKRCSDKRDCTGECLYEGPDPPPERATGTCQRTSDPCGCKAPIHHGHAEPALCAD